MARVPERTTFDVEPKARSPFGMDSLVEGGPDIDVVEGDADIKQLAEDVKFMNEMLRVVFIGNSDPNMPKFVELGVNIAGQTGPMDEDGTPGVARKGGQRVRRGYGYERSYEIPRFLVEVLAHAKTIEIKQVPNPNDPMQIMHVERPRFTYPFSVVHDPSGAKGAAWVAARMKDPA